MKLWKPVLKRGEVSNRQYVEKRSQCRKFWVVEMHPSDENEAMICSWEEKLRSRRHGCGWLGGPEVLLSFVMKWKPGEKMSRSRKATMLRQATFSKYHLLSSGTSTAVLQFRFHFVQKFKIYSAKFWLKIGQRRLPGKAWCRNPTPKTTPLGGRRNCAAFAGGGARWYKLGSCRFNQQHQFKIIKFFLIFLRLVVMNLKWRAAALFSNEEASSWNCLVKKLQHHSQ